MCLLARNGLVGEFLGPIKTNEIVHYYVYHFSYGSKILPLNNS